MQFVEIENQWYIELRRTWGQKVNSGPYTNIPLLLREIRNEEGVFYDLLVDSKQMHVVTDHTASEYLLIEMDTDEVAVQSETTAEFILQVPLQIRS